MRYRIKTRVMVSAWWPFYVLAHAPSQNKGANYFVMHLGRNNLTRIHSHALRLVLGMRLFLWGVGEGGAEEDDWRQEVFPHPEL